MKKSPILIFLRAHKIFFYLTLILLLGLYLRLYNINWDENNYFHPDERAIIMFALELNWPTSLQEFLSSQSPLNPHFFAYGTFPIYLLKAATIAIAHYFPSLDTYGGMHLVGRPISALFDTATIILVFLLGRRIFSPRTGLFAAFFYSASVLPIQLSHFFAVDTILTFFITASLLVLIEFLQRPTRRLGIVLGLCVGLSLATKVSALILGPVILFAIITLLYKHRGSKKFVMHIVATMCLAAGTAVLVFFVTQPYAFIDWRVFLQQTTLQSQMSRNAYLFPYTLQYVHKLPYIYELKNIFLWGLGPSIATLSFGGLIALLILYIKRDGKTTLGIFLLFIGMYFLLFGGFAVGYMRYMLPLYPLFAVTGGYFISEIIIKRIPHRHIATTVKRKILLLLFILLCLYYPFSFISIYKLPNTRIQATEWILANIPAGSVIAIEHWDDALPLTSRDRYNTITLPLYEKDTAVKWQGINKQLQETEYIILASHRLFVPLPKLKDCDKVEPGFCYPLTAAYYENLFNGSLGFSKVAEFVSQPKLPFLPLYINDFPADENFTVFDHPRILIFKKTQ